MARQLRIEYEDAWYHITCRGNERQAIFADDLDREKFFEILAASIEQYNVEVHAYVLMSNHFHIVVKTRKANLQKFMQRFNTSYTVYYNRKHKRSGHLYQGRYKAILIEADSYLLELSRYVHLNPVRIKKYTKKSIEEKTKIVKEYVWSSYAGYCNVKKRQGFVDYSMIIEMLSKKDDGKGRKVYQQFIYDGILKDMNITFWEDVKGQAVLGTDSFIDYIYDRFLADRDIEKKKRVKIENLRSRLETPEEIAESVAEVFGVKDEKELFQKYTRNRYARSVFLELSRKYLGAKMSNVELGRQFGNMSGAAINENRKRIQEVIKNNKEVRKLYQRAEKKLKTRLI